MPTDTLPKKEAVCGVVHYLGLKTERYLSGHRHHTQLTQLALLCVAVFVNKTAGLRARQFKDEL
nr:MAG: hypothetical protein [Microvirus sp.]